MGSQVPSGRECSLHRHPASGLNYSKATTDADRHGDAPDLEEGTVGTDTSGPTTDDAMTRSKERLNVGTASQEVGRARLRKYVVTEQQSVSVPVTREEVRVEREPITEENRAEALSGPEWNEKTKHPVNADGRCSSADDGSTK
ncbi:YsnF/AvaK domain-containing protein [Nostocoides sp. HKS02]|uniref:YsnF/AvaK domain-containing protein n=1 Tax=Nostocoides sp. HKS02 TaxID=1813880 RepID=UPI0012B49B2B|nr:DUF2382 domain-containing protein [Tetrasphaera sp. HKS02]